MRELGIITVSRNQQDRWKRGQLADEWASRYPNLFDDDDVRLAKAQGSKGYHFFEWLGAVLLHHSTGFDALVSKYEFAKHARKRKIADRLLAPDVHDLLRDRTEHGNAQAPDLLMYAPDFSSFFFCEVKGPTDRLSQAQESKFNAIERLISTEVGLLRFRWATGLASSPAT